MRLSYYPDTESLYIELRDEPGAHSHEIIDGLLADLSEEGAVVGLDIDCAIHKTDLAEIEAIGLSFQKSIQSC